MNLDLYTDEYRNFKYLKLSPELLARFKFTRACRNKVQNWHDTQINNWPHAVEFAEQVFDLKDETLYIVTTGMLNSKNQYEDANLLVIDKPIILDSNPIIYNGFEYCTSDHIPYLDDCLNSHFCLLSRNSFYNNGEFIADSRVIRWNTLPMAAKLSIDFTAVFYNRDTAELYRKTLTEMLRYKPDSVSSFSRHM